MNADFMSSEECIQDSSDDEDIEQPLLAKIITWRASKVNKFFQTLDEFAEKNKSAQSKRQSKKRIFSEIGINQRSTR